MKCDRCENEATVHEVMISGGKSMERHMCERCAAAAGVQIQQQPPAVSQILSQLMKAGASAAGSAPQQPGAQPAGQCSACPGCGLGFAQFRQAGMLGCPQCYVSFEGQLGPLLSRAHEGGMHHVGKIPRSIELARTAPPGSEAASSSGHAARQADEQAEERNRAATLRKQLADAVAAENYERAALLRDELHKLEAIIRSATAPTGAPSLARPPRASRKPKADPGEEGNAR